MQDQFRRAVFSSHNQITSTNHTGENRIKETFRLLERRNCGPVFSVTNLADPVSVDNSFDAGPFVGVPYLPIDRISTPI